MVSSCRPTKLEVGLLRSRNSQRGVSAAVLLLSIALDPLKAKSITTVDASENLVDFIGNNRIDHGEYSA